MTTPREQAQEKGFWDGGSAGHGTNKESGGGTSGTPGRRIPRRTGVRTDLEFPPEPQPDTAAEERR